MAKRIITVCESDDKTCPADMQWQYAYRKLAGNPVMGCEYMVRHDGPGIHSSTTHHVTLTDARRAARASVRNGRAWAEIFRWAENAQLLRRVFIASYEVETESGSSL